MSYSCGLDAARTWLSGAMAELTRTARSKTVRRCLIVLALVTGGCAATIQHSDGFAQPASPLPIDLPVPVTAHTTAKKVFAHYFTPFLISLDNKPAASDYYTQGYLDPAGENGAHAASGGFLRERPLPRAVSSSHTWDLDDMKTDVRRASAAGIDGFTVDLLSLSGYNWDRVKMLITAAHQVDPSFTIMLMPDATTDVVDDPHALAVAIAGLAADTSTYHLSDGRLVVSPFYAEGRSAAWWAAWLSTMRTEFGINVAFVPTFLDYGNAAAFSSISYGFSTWGDRSPNSIGGSVGEAQDAHAKGKLWMQPVAVQDARPYAGVYTEADNTETLRGLWNIAIQQNAEWVQLVTWNDYSEGTEISPSSHIGWSPLDLVSYYATWFKTGSEPTIVRDVLYLSHRIQPAAARPTGPETQLMQLRDGSSPARDQVELLAFLTGPARIMINVGSATYTYDAPAGRSSTDVPLGIGTVSANVTYANGASLSVTSPNPVVARPVVQDLQYYFASSSRDGVINGTPPATTTPPPTTAPPATTTTTTTPAPTTTPVTTPVTLPIPTIPPVTLPPINVPSGIVGVPLTTPTASPTITPAGASAVVGGVSVGLPPVPPWAR
ncbi:MAG: hypothetical protein JWM34_1188 [Ilumatobacteraceae bacterium]|nr:hypothetical protein [Ilumatobacteraceae bacterium]